MAASEKRRAYRREIKRDRDKDVPDTAAETEKVSGLVVREYVPPAKNSGGSTGRTGKGEKKDFKGYECRCRIAAFAADFARP